MIVPSMAFTEIHNELFKDMATLTHKIILFTKEFRRRVLKASRYPFTHSYECYGRLNKNLFIITFIAMKRSDKRDPILGVRCLYNRPEGVYAAVLSLEDKTTTIYPPHFFKRYRERIEKNFLASNVDMIKHYFTSGWGFMFVVLSRDTECVYRRFENEIKNDALRFVCAIAVGYCFGEQQGNNIYIMKTIISEDMLFESQKEAFSNLRKDFIEANKEWYGINISDEGQWFQEMKKRLLMAWPK
jgi:hypothetical protein